MRHYSDIATYSSFFTFIFIIISPSSRHVMLIDRVVIHPGWQLQFKVVDSTAIVILSLPRCSTRLDMLVRIKRRTTRVPKRSQLFAIVIMVTGHQSDVAEELCRSEPQDDILISFADWTLAIIDPLKSSGLSPGKRPGSFGASRLYGIARYRLIRYWIYVSPQFIVDYNMRL